MNVDQAVIIFFRLLNFAVLIGIMVYLWRKYGRLYVVAEYEKWQNYLTSLTQTYTLLHQEDRSIKRGYKNDEQERSELRERLFAWRDAVQKEESSLADEKEKRVHELGERMKEQAIRVQECRLYRQIQKEAVSEVRDRLSKEYSSSAAQEQVIGSIMKRLDAA